MKRKFVEFMFGVLTSLALIVITSILVWLGYVALFSTTASIFMRLICGSILATVACVIIIFLAEPSEIIGEKNREDEKWKTK